MGDNGNTGGDGEKVSGLKIQPGDDEATILLKQLKQYQPLTGMSDEQIGYHVENFKRRKAGEAENQGSRV